MLIGVSLIVPGGMSVKVRDDSSVLVEQGGEQRTTPAMRSPGEAGLMISPTHWLIDVSPPQPHAPTQGVHALVNNDMTGGLEFGANVMIVAISISIGLFAASVIMYRPRLKVSNAVFF